MQTLVFMTEGLIDIRSFTTFGINAKPNSENPIGFFGTGLKYAVAVLCRLGGRVTVKIDGVTHEFFSQSGDFRGKEFQFIRMRKRNSLLGRWRYEQLPFTTEFGKNWGAWQVFRELESNTRDENGSTFLVERNDSEFFEDPHHGRTLIMVDAPEVIEAYHDRDDIFLPESLNRRVSSDRIEIFNKPSNYIYFRGLRVADLEKPTAFTYNILEPLELTEDRTVKYMFYVKNAILSAIFRSADADYVETILQLDPEQFFEGSLDFDSHYDVAGSAFMGALGGLVNKRTTVLPRAMTYYHRYYAPEPSDPEITLQMKRSEWSKILEVMEKIDLGDISGELGWDEQDDRFDPWIFLRDKLSQDAPIVEDKVDFPSEN